MLVEYNRINKIILILSYFSLLIVLMGLGFFLHYQNYHPLAFIAIYVVLLCWPFIWMLPHNNLDQFNIFNGIIIGIITVIIVGVFHLFHFLSKGSNNSFLFIIPGAALLETLAVGSFFIEKHKSTKE